MNCQLSAKMGLMGRRKIRELRDLASLHIIAPYVNESAPYPGALLVTDLS
jgi:hypothetical protein